MFKQERRLSMNKEMYGVINDGFELLKNPYFDNNMFLVWLDYSRKMLDLVSQNTMVKYQYSSFLMSIIGSNEDAKVKLQKCIDYLINILPLI